MDMNLSKLWETVKDRGTCVSLGLQRVGHDLVIKQQQQTHLIWGFAI